MSWMDQLPEKAADNVISIIGTALFAFVAMVIRNARTSAVISTRLDEIEKKRDAEMQSVKDWMQRMEAKQDRLHDHLIQRKDD